MGHQEVGSTFICGWAWLQAVRGLRLQDEAVFVLGTSVAVKIDQKALG